MHELPAIHQIVTTQATDRFLAALLRWNVKIFEHFAENMRLRTHCCEEGLRRSADGFRANRNTKRPSEIDGEQFIECIWLRAIRTQNDGSTVSHLELNSWWRCFGRVRIRWWLHAAYCRVPRLALCQRNSETFSMSFCGSSCRRGGHSWSRHGISNCVSW